MNFLFKGIFSQSVCEEAELYRDDFKSSNGLVKHVKSDYEVFKHVQDRKNKEVNDTLTADHSMIAKNKEVDTAIHSLIAVCTSFPKTSEASFLNPAIENYMIQCEFGEDEAFLRDKAEQMKVELSPKRLDDALEYFARRLSVFDAKNFVAIHREKVLEDPERKEYFERTGLMSEEDAFCCAFVLSFYTGLNYKVDDRQVFRLENLDANNNKHYSTISGYLLQAINTIPCYWGICIRTLNLTSAQQELYSEGSIISWNIFSSAGKGNKPTKTFLERNTYFYIWSLTGREIQKFSNFPNENEILFPPYTTFLVVKKVTSFLSNKVSFYLREVELGYSDRPVLWVDDFIFQQSKDNEFFKEQASSRGFGNNIQLIPKMSTEQALNFLDSEFGQRLKKSDKLKIITDMARPDEENGKYAGAIFLQKLRERGFKQKVLVYVMNKTVARAAVKICCEDISGDYIISNNRNDPVSFIIS